MHAKKLPLKFEKAYIYGFLLPSFVIILGMMYFQMVSLGNIMTAGFVFIMGELFFINKALYGKKEWLYSEIAFVLRMIALLILYSKIIVL